MTSSTDSSSGFFLAAVKPHVHISPIVQPQRLLRLKPSTRLFELLKEVLPSVSTSPPDMIDPSLLHGFEAQYVCRVAIIKPRTENSTLNPGVFSQSQILCISPSLSRSHPWEISHTSDACSLLEGVLETPRLRSSPSVRIPIHYCVSLWICDYQTTYSSTSPASMFSVHVAHCVALFQLSVCFDISSKTQWEAKGVEFEEVTCDCAPTVQEPEYGRRNNVWHVRNSSDCAAAGQEPPATPARQTMHDTSDVLVKVLPYCYWYHYCTSLWGTKVIVFGTMTTLEVSARRYSPSQKSFRARNLCVSINI